MNDSKHRSGWNGSWYLTNDRGDWRYLYKFVPDNRRDLTTGQLYGLKFNRLTMTGMWIPIENAIDPDTEMQARHRTGRPRRVCMRSRRPRESSARRARAASAATRSSSPSFSESGVGADPGRIWRLEKLGNDGFVTGRVLAEGDWARLGRPDNLRFTDAGDLFMMEDHSGSDWRNNPSTGGVNQIWVLPRNQRGTSNLILFGKTPDEATGPWFSFDNKLLYVSTHADPPRQSRVIAIRAPRSFNQPYDR